MTDMIEQAARAIEKEFRRDLANMKYSDLAIAAIKSMREPTEGMFDAAGFVYGADDVLPFWQAMIDAALGGAK